jgi:hypothetical protein
VDLTPLGYGERGPEQKKARFMLREEIASYKVSFTHGKVVLSPENVDNLGIYCVNLGG